jgi:hypothetical protein
MAKVAGSLWVTGDYLHFVASNGVEYRFGGAYGGGYIAAAIPGSIWIEGDYIKWITATGYSVYVPTAGVSSPAGAISGSIWVDDTGVANTTTSTQLRIIAASGPYHRVAYVHEDAAHSDHTDHSDSHTDTPYSDIIHGDTDHTNGGANYSVSITYEPSQHVDHNDAPVEYLDSGTNTIHGDYTDDVNHIDHTANFVHTDVAHSDVAHVDHTDDVSSGHADYYNPTYVGA